MEQLLQELRSFLDAEVPRFREKWGDDAGSWEARCAWQRTTAGGKWPAPAWSEEHGGRGTCVATLASDDVHGARTTVSDDAAGGRLSGAKTHVLDAHIADVLLVTAVRGERVQLFAVDPRAEGAELRPLTVLDHTRKQFRVELTDVKGQLLDEDFGAGLSLTLYVAAVRFPGDLGHGPERGGADRRRRRPLMVYDAYARIPLYGVEDLGCVGRGEAVVFIESGATRPGDSLPMNTNGGGLLYTHAGLSACSPTRAVRQLRGDAAVPVEGVRTNLVQGIGGLFSAAGTLVPSQFSTIAPTTGLAVHHARRILRGRTGVQGRGRHRLDHAEPPAPAQCRAQIAA
ncbi:thiolase C-terminal domain-containing protein [Streptomyces canus]|uniref:thiolase C-terminal domain-containing protein n=1 Tax=Streptomyces canus TaxID=58343 RepID=UPI002E37C088|nr:hypothetical protein [Streptomyces canus]